MKSKYIKPKDNTLNDAIDINDVETPSFQKFIKIQNVDLEELNSQYSTKQLEIINEIKKSPEYKEMENLDDAQFSSLREFNIQMYHKIRKITSERPRKPSIIDTPEKQELEYNKCKYDIVYYLENYVMFEIAGGLSPMIVTDKIRLAARLYEASVLTVAMAARQKGKTSIQNACTGWYFNFWNSTNTLLLNLTVAANKKNLRIIEGFIEKLPDWLKTYRQDDPNCTANVYEKISALNSKVSSLVVADDADATGRGYTGCVMYDELAYLKDIEEAYSTLAFVYSAYSSFASMMMTPAPQWIASTPNALTDPSGEFFWGIFNNATEVNYDQIKSLLPFEIKDFLTAQGITTVKVFIEWFEMILPDKDLHIIDPDDERNCLTELRNPNTSPQRIYEIHPALGTWMATQRGICLHNPVKIKKDIYCIPPTSLTNAIFNEEALELLQTFKVTPYKSVDLDAAFNGKLNFNTKISEIDFVSGKYLLVVDPAYTLSQSGDYCAFVILDIATKNVIAVARVKTGKVKNIYKIIRQIQTLFNNRLVIAVEKNSFGVAVIEDCEEDLEILQRLYYPFVTDKYGKRTFKELDGKILYGHVTTKDNRPLVIEKLQTMVNEEPEKIRDSELISEITTLVNKNNKVQASTGCHDDVCMAYGIGLFIIDEQMDVLNKLLYSSEQQRINLSTINEINSNRPYEEIEEAIREIKHTKSDDYLKNYDDPLKEFKKEKQNNNKTGNIHSMFSALNS